MTSIKNHIVLLMLMLGSFYSVNAQQATPIKITDLSARIESHPDTTFIVNLWATWCAPCVKELPLFEEVNQLYNSQPIKVLLVSLDLKRDLDTRLKSFLERKNLKSEVLFLDEKDPNEWIPFVNDLWEGVIPATWIVSKDKSINNFYPHPFEGEELKGLLKDLKVVK